jgi:hypothetical protein
MARLTRRPRRLTLQLRRVGIAALSLALSGCAGSAGGLSGPPPQRGGPAVTYVALGEQLPSTETDPRMSWPSEFAKSALPYWATTYEIDLEDGWTFDLGSIQTQVTALHPSVASIEVGLDEALSGYSVESFSAALAQLLAALKGAHVSTILVGDLPPVPSQSVASSLTAAVGEYNAAITADVRGAGAVLVDVHTVLSRAMSTGKEVMSGGNALTPLGETLIAAAFAAAVKHLRSASSKR